MNCSLKKVKLQSGTDIAASKSFYEGYDRSLDIRFYGSDNLYPQNIKNFFETSPSLFAAVQRKVDFLMGSSGASELIDENTLKALLTDYSLFGGFALYISYNGLGDIAYISHVDFKTIRLGEQGSDGLFSYVYYSPDWSDQITVNRRRVKSKSDKVRYYIYSGNIETRLRRMSDNGTSGEILYYSNTKGYPVEPSRPVLQYVSAECGIANETYRSVRSSFVSSSVLSVPMQSEQDLAQIADDLEALQGDTDSFKILLMSHSTPEDKPEVLSLSAEDYTTRLTASAELCKNKILEAYSQSNFGRLDSGGLGFSTDIVSQVNEVYNWSLTRERNSIESFLKEVDPSFRLEPLPELTVAAETV